MNKNSLKYCVNLDSPIAVFVQIENQVQFHIVSGKYQSGDSLPSVREMTRMLNVNPNTITKAYRDLEVVGIVSARRGVGVTVAENALKIARANVVDMVKCHLRDAVAECTAVGMGAEEIHAMAEQGVESRRLPYQPG